MKLFCRSRFGSTRSVPRQGHGCGGTGGGHTSNRAQVGSEGPGLSLSGLLDPWAGCCWRPQERLARALMGKEEEMPRQLRPSAMSSPGPGTASPLASSLGHQLWGLPGNPGVPLFSQHYASPQCLCQEETSPAIPGQLRTIKKMSLVLSSSRPRPRGVGGSQGRQQRTPCVKGKGCGRKQLDPFPSPRQAGTSLPAAPC